MSRFTLSPLFLVATLTLSAQDAPQTAARDANIDMVARDLHAISRIANLADDIARERQLMKAILDNDISTLRMPREDGTYRWASLQREEEGRVTDEKDVQRAHTETELREITVTGDNGYRVEVLVPRKRSTFSANNRVWVRNVLVDSTGFDGKTSHHEIPVNAWVSPGDATGVALPEIGKSVKATVETGVESGEKQAVAQVALVQAKLVDDPNSPYFPAIRRLLQVREIVAAKEINRGQLKNSTDEALLSLPGELEKRTAEMEEAARVRRQMAEMGTTTGAIAVGDATPDVTRELAEIAKLSAGTLQDQAAARTRLDALIAALKPKP
jgi:hypothetical protein